ncbi:hypothetical protein [Mycolicibacterium llatzerense]|uniref:hypothetical protein n=1 Tax=Mycolicibacterium llatzerense TaxID=280871 RepID=UPI0021B6B6BA|nr:hypothetical protein [Mycolicibacterium llatzerense]MCT7364020.1 hypothetical protein [Mycolicibacterium llatzerense]
MNLHTIISVVTVPIMLIGTISCLFRLINLNGRGIGYAFAPVLFAGMALVPLNFMPAMAAYIAPRPSDAHTPGLLDHLFDPISAPDTTAAAPTTSVAPKPAPSSPYAAPPASAEPSTPIDWTPFIIAAAVAAGGGGLGYAGYKTWSAIDERRHRKALREVARQAQLDRWAIGLASYTIAAEALMAFETDPESVYFTRPLLSDTNEPATASFYTAFGAAQSLKLETAPSDDTAIDAFVAAATAAEQAFLEADQNARRKARIGIVHQDRRLTDTEKRKLDQARKLMSTATHPGTSPTEAQAAHTKALFLLDDVGVIVPERLVTNVTRCIETVQRQAITA